MDFFKENISLIEVLVQAAAFLIVFFTLRKFAWGPLVHIIKSRREKFESEWGGIEKTQKDLEDMKKHYQTHLAKIEDEAHARMQEAVQEGRRIAREIQEKARLESQTSFDKAKANIDLEVEKARITLRREIADLSIRIAEKIVSEKMDAPRQEKKALEILGDLEKQL
ncbi:MAG TPA: F0F1 ATP synthase subunit B [Candidatus Omnitrophota bacterium]|nr:F0F1 ATP synthase subunit B [Candidatus Omnitrophota bacterium]HPS36208.1 F0F1 ATP synthase subunit B [Candidatus Omnitrophota bacterium]